MNKLILATGLILAATASTAETYNMAGAWSGQNRSTIMPIAEGHMVIFAKNEYQKFDPVSADNPTSDMSGRCGGSMVIQVPAVSGSGNCLFTDTEGNQNVLQWTATRMSADGAIEGTWVIVGGTGKFEGSSGGGSFSSKTDQGTGAFVNTLTGAMHLQ